MNNQKITLDDYEFIFRTKLNGFIYHKRNQIRIEETLLDVLKKQRNVNLNRNISILRYTFYIDNLLHNENIERCWLKGIRDLFNYPYLIDKRQMADVDVLVKDTEKTRAVLLREGLSHGGYDYNGNWITGDKAEIREFERGHYELFPLSKKLPIHIENSLNLQYLNNSKVYKDDSGFFTDIIYDVHRELTFGLKPDWLFQKHSFLPVMNELDDLWYMINKCYYEILEGDSINIQSLILTLRKIESSHYTIDEIKDRVIETGFYNANALYLMYELSNNNISEQRLDSIVNQLINKINKLLSNLK
ncbi:nucleotidyltransferase family protein [Salinibacillus kushneri]|nr:nucleotidyltransferase family protein [Salinibacillus kushneri]